MDVHCQFDEQRSGRIDRDRQIDLQSLLQLRCYTETWDECESLRRRILEERGEAKATKTAVAAMLHFELWIRLHHDAACEYVKPAFFQLQNL